MISALCPSRGRPELLAKSLGSLRDFASGEVELLVAADEDDGATMTVAGGLGAQLLVMKRAGYGRLHEYYQELAAMATGDWLLVWSDDALMVTPGFDAIIDSVPERYLVADLLNPHSPLCCFPAVRRAAVEALGRFCTDNPHVDTFWQDVGYQTERIRTVNVRVAHDRPDITGRALDQTAIDVIAGHRTADFYGAEHQADLARCVEIIRAKFPPGG